MFNLEDEFTKWRLGMAKAGLRSPELIRELEEHLREDIDRQVRSGTAAAEAFQVAVDRLGRPSALKNEFDVINRMSVGSLLRRHTWKLVVCTMAGLLAAGTLHLLRPASYISQAKLFVRYIIMEVSPGFTPDQPVRRIVPDGTATAAVMAEVEIFTSLDLAEQVAKAIGPEKILRGVERGDDLARAAAVIKGGLTVIVPANSNVMHLAFRHPNSKIVQPVLREAIDQYLRIHVEKARASGRPRPIAKVSNISSISAPSSPVFDFAASSRMLAILVTAGIASGLAWTLGAVWYAKYAERTQPGIG